jgi:hypothetical protein
MPKTSEDNSSLQNKEVIALQRQATVVKIVDETVDIPMGRSLVVVIGIDRYVHKNPLKNAVSDAVGIQQVLIDKLGFSNPIEPLLNEAATKLAIDDLINNRLYDEVQENDNLIIFFAGHGTTRVREVGDKEIETGYLVPVDAKDSWSEYVEIDPLLHNISALPARHILVIFDSCESGLVLGQSMQSFRDIKHYQKDLSHRFSRKIITSAQRDQLAQDGGGPIPGNSLFTGIMIDGLNWGKADLDINGLITSSELGLFIQQQVSQASNSSQTPDFGSFHLDDRGEMVISLRNQSFDALKARAFSALCNCDFVGFKELVEQILLLKPSSPEALYLNYKLMLLENNIDRAIEIIHKLLDLNPPEGSIPISRDDLWGLDIQLPCWQPLLRIPMSEFSFEITLLNGLDEESLLPIQPKHYGDKAVYLIEDKTLIKFKVANTTQENIYLYMAEFDSHGRFSLISFWDTAETAWSGLLPGIVQFSYPLQITKEEEVSELRLFASPKRIDDLFNSPGINARASRPMELSGEKLQNVQAKSFYYRSVLQNSTLAYSQQ